MSTIDRYQRQKMRLEALLAIVPFKEEFFGMLRRSKNEQDAEEKLIASFNLSTEQAKYVLNAELKHFNSLTVEDLQTKLEKVDRYINKMTINNKELLENSAKENPLYKFFEKCEFLKTVDLEQTYWRGKRSKWSLSFSVSGKDECATLKSIFGVTNENFSDKYNEAVSGLEKKRIMTLHSSSLAALLLFHSVSECNPIYIPINGTPVAFTSAKFEEKNIVDKSDPKNKSNIDVVLLGNDCRLYLESKFSEYLSSGPQEISNTDYYEEIYRYLKYYLERCEGLSVEIDDKTKKICIEGKGKYCEGTKQMISHYLGIKTAMTPTSNIKQSTVVLGEVLFYFDNEKAGNKFKSYNEIYDSLKEGLTARAKAEKIDLTINDLITYQQILELEENRTFVANLPEKIKQLYHITL